MDALLLQTGSLNLQASYYLSYESLQDKNISQLCIQCIFKDSSSVSGAFVEWKCFAKSWELSYISTIMCLSAMETFMSYDHACYRQSHDALAAAQVSQLEHNTQIFSSDAPGRELVQG